MIISMINYFYKKNVDKKILSKFYMINYGNLIAYKIKLNATTKIFIEWQISNYLLESMCFPRVDKNVL